VRFIHCADLHLDTPFSGLADSRSAEIRQAELRSTFLAIIERAKQTDALIIAGDLFDQESLEPETVRTLVKGFASLGEIPVFIAAGNHDPLTEASYYRLAPLPANVHVFGTEPTRFSVADCEICGISFAGAQQEEALPLPSAGSQERPFICVMHGNVGGHDYNPISREQVAESGISYLALGHVHSYSREMIQKTLCVYPGCPEGRGFDEWGSKGVVEAVVTREGAKASFVPLCRREHQVHEVDVTGLTTNEEITAMLCDKITEEKDLYKFVLTGETEAVPHCDVIKAGLAPCFFAKIYDKTKRPLDIAALLAEPGVRGMFVQKIMEEQALHDEALCRKALELGLMALSGEKVKLS